jgi:hypothetical protein
MLDDLGVGAQPNAFGCIQTHMATGHGAIGSYEGLNLIRKIHDTRSAILTVEG